ncbi:MAG: hypothetical protein RLZ12_453, partial [Bacillota bacterium]
MNRKPFRPLSYFLLGTILFCSPTKAADEIRSRENRYLIEDQITSAKKPAPAIDNTPSYHVYVPVT